MGTLAKHLPLAGICRGTLYVQAVSSVAAQEFRLRQKEILRRIRKHFKEGEIRNILIKKGAGQP